MRLSGGLHQLSSFAEIEQFTNFVVGRLDAATAKLFTGRDDFSFTRLTLAMYAVGEDNSRALANFLSNRYFLDACGVAQLPDLHELEGWIALHEPRLTSTLKALLPAANPATQTLSDVIRCLVEFWHTEGDTFGALTLYGPETRAKLQRDGYCVIPSVFDPALCAETKDDILRVANVERAREAAYFYGRNNRFQRVYNIITKTAFVQTFLAHPLVRVVMNDMFDRRTLHDKYYLSSFHANLIPDQGEAQKLHVDAAVPDPLPTWIVRANINFLLEDYEYANGATLCIPGSHLWGRKPGPDDAARFADQLRPIEAPVGSMVVWHGHLWHQSGYNRSSRERVALLACFAASFLLEMALEENHFRIMSEAFARALPGDLHRLLGWGHGIKLGAH